PPFPPLPLPLPPPLPGPCALTAPMPANPSVALVARTIAVFLIRLLTIDTSYSFCFVKSSVDVALVTVRCATRNRPRLSLLSGYALMIVAIQAAMVIAALSNLKSILNAIGMLLTVTDAVDCACSVIGDQQRTIRHNLH